MSRQTGPVSFEVEVNGNLLRRHLDQLRQRVGEIETDKSFQPSQVTVTGNFSDTVPINSDEPVQDTVPEPIACPSPISTP